MEISNGKRKGVYNISMGFIREDGFSLD